MHRATGRFRSAALLLVKLCCYVTATHAGRERWHPNHSPDLDHHWLRRPGCEGSLQFPRGHRDFQFQLLTRSQESEFRSQESGSSNDLLMARLCWRNCFGGRSGGRRTVAAASGFRLKSQNSEATERRPPRRFRRSPRPIRGGARRSCVHGQSRDDSFMQPCSGHCARDKLAILRHR